MPEITPKEATVLVYKITEAMKMDYDSRPDSLKDGSFSLLSFSDELFKSYPNVGNKTVLRSGRRLGRLIVNDKYEKGGLIQPSDLLIIAKFLFRNHGNYRWSNVRNVIRDEGEKFHYLLDVEPLEDYPQIELQSLLSEPLRRYTVPGKPLGDQLREVASRIDDLEKRMLKREDELVKGDQTIVKMAKENAELKSENAKVTKMVSEALRIISLIENARAKETDPKKLNTINENLKRFKQKLKEIQK